MYNIKDFANVLELKNIGVVGKNIFLFTLPAEIDEGITVKPTLDGVPIDPDLPNFFKSKLQVIVRAKKYDDGLAISFNIEKALNLYNIQLEHVYVNYCRLKQQPVIYKRQDNGTIEFSLNFELCYIYN